jgi:fibronectin-binding autotransporter adhesin
MNIPVRTLTRLATLVAALSLGSSAPAQTFWTGVNNVSATTNWSDTLNWSTFASPGGTDVVFTNTGVATLGTINNVVDTSTSLASLTYANTNGSHTTLIAPGVTLDISGLSGPNGSALFAGAPVTTDVPAFTNVITGAGAALTINSSFANLIVRQGPNGGAVGNRVTLDLSGVDTFNATVGRVLLSGNSPATQNRSTGRLILAKTNVITASGTSPALVVGESTSNNGGGSTVVLGQTNALFVNNIAIGRTKENGSSIRFNTAFANSTALIRGADGVSALGSWTMGDGAADSGTTTCNGTSDFSGGTVDALVTTMQVGRGSSGGTGGNQSVGTFTFSGGTVEVATLQIGLQGGSNAKGGSGTMNVNGGLLRVTSALELGRTVGGVGYNLTVARLNINGGTVETPAITASYSGLISTNNNIAMTNGTLIVADLAGPGITSFTMSNSVLTVKALASGATVIVTNHAQGGTTNRINITEVPVIAAYPAQFPIIKYSGALGGTFNTGLGTLPASSPAFSGYISNNTANSSIDLVITGGPVPARQISWSGATDSNWDTTTANWRFSGSPTTYNQEDFVRFDDSATGTPTVNLTAAMQPSSVTVSNQGKTYGLTGSGTLSGVTGITKDGAGTLYITNSGINDYTGGLNLIAGTVRVGDGGFSGNLGTGNIANNGTLIFNRGDAVTVADVISGAGTVTKQGAGVLTLSGGNSYTGATLVQAGTLSTLNNTALGATNGTTTVSSGASLDVNARNLGAEIVNVSGVGDGGAGAIVNSGAQSLNALRYVTLLGNTTFGGAGRWDIRAAPSTGDPSLAALSTGGNAYSLTKIGFNQISIVGATVDPALGNVDVQQGTLSLETAVTGLGNPANSLTVAAGATMQLFNLTNQLNKVILLSSDSFTPSLVNASGANTILGPITLVNDAVFNVNGTSLNVAGNLTGGLLTKQGSGNLIVSGTATHAGTVANVGTFTVNGTHSGGVTNTSTFTVFGGAGNVTGFSDLAGFLLPGSTNAIGTLTLSGLVLQGGAIPVFDLGPTATVGGIANDLVVVNGNLTVNGNTIEIKPVGLLQLGVPYRLFNYTGSLIENAPLNVASVNGYNFTVSTATPGQINIVASGGPPVWNGGSLTVNNWSDPANWNGVTIQPNDTLYFAGGSRLNNINDTAADTTYTDLVFSTGAGAFTLNGNSVILAGSIVNSSENSQRVNLPITVNTSGRVLSGDTAPLIIGGGLTNAAVGFSTLRFDGTGTLTNLIGDIGGGTNVIAMNDTNGNWTLVDNAANAPITVPWAFAISNGTFNFGSGASAPVFTSTTVNGQPTDNQLGSVSGADATFNMVAGTLTTTARFNTATGLNSTSTVNQVGGTWNLGNQFQGANGGNAGQLSVVNVSGGTLNIGTAAAPNSQLYLASRGNGVLNVSGGTLNCGILDLARNAAGNTVSCNGTVNLNGGTLAVQRVGTATANAQTGVTFAPSATFNFNGGTLKARQNQGAFLQGSTIAPIIPIAAIVKSGGAVFDTDGFNVTVSEVLQHDSTLGGTPDGGLTKNGAGALTLSAANTYTGPTAVNGGSLLINGSVLGAVTAASGGTVGGNGNLGSTLAVSAGGTVSPGLSVGILTATNNVTLGGTTFMEIHQALATNDLLRSISGSITYGGTLTATNLGGLLTNGNSFKLFNAGSYLGSFSTLQLPGLGSGQSWNISQLNVSGTISVVGNPAPPSIASVVASGGNLLISGGGGVTNGTYQLLTSTNVTLPVASWTVLGNGQFDGNGDFATQVAIDPGTPQRYFRVRMP